MKHSKVQLEKIKRNYLEQVKESKIYRGEEFQKAIVSPYNEIVDGFLSKVDHWDGNGITIANGATRAYDAGKRCVDEILNYVESLIYID